MLFLKRIVRTKLDIYVLILSHYLYIGNRCLILFQKEIYNHYMLKSCLKLRIHVLRQGRLLWYVMKSNPAHGEVYSTQQYVIKFVSVTWDRSVVFSWSSVFSTNKTDRHDIAEILLKVTLNTITLTLKYLDSNYLESIANNNKGNNKITELRTIFQRENQNS